VKQQAISARPTRRNFPIKFKPDHYYLVLFVAIFVPVRW
jgi:hypothetical protein